MRAHRFLIAVAALAVPAVFLTTAGDASGLQPKERTVWRHKDGFFENTKGNDWFEKSANGTFRFKEVRRVEAYIDLENINSGNRVRLLNDRCVKVDKDGREQNEYYKGGWE